MVDVPKDVTANKTEFEVVKPKEVERVSIKNPEKIKKVQDMIRNAKQPIIYAGGGIISANATEIFKNLQSLQIFPFAVRLWDLAVFLPTTRFVWVI